jgi:hypothetical protein
VTRFEKWFVARIIRREVKQGSMHLTNITGIYQMVREACIEEFYEDNAVTLDATLRECFIAASAKPKCTDGFAAGSVV